MNRRNLAKLAAYLERLPADYGKFGMESFMRLLNTPGLDAFIEPHGIKDIPCGAVACAVGHAPAAGIAVHPTDTTWGAYSERTLIDPGEGAWDWCFSDLWVNVDNTPQGAAARIRWLLKHGLPDNADDQMSGDDPLCYVAKRATTPAASADRPKPGMNT